MQGEVEHFYGDHVHILNSKTSSTLLTRLCSPQCHQPEATRLVKFLYTQLLLHVLEQEFSAKAIDFETRMTAHHPEQRLTSTILDDSVKITTVNIARAGSVPSQTIYELLHLFFMPENLRQDHVFASRQLNQKDEVIGTDLGNSKLSGKITEATVLIPDPMGATGGTLDAVVSHYKNLYPQTKIRWISINLIVTPEFLKKLKATHPDLQVFSLRLDRGLSDQATLNSVFGKHWDREKGLNSNHYIVPGAGGLGELLNNSEH